MKMVDKEEIVALWFDYNESHDVDSYKDVFVDAYSRGLSKAEEKLAEKDKRIAELEFAYDGIRSVAGKVPPLERELAELEAHHVACQLCPDECCCSDCPHYPTSRPDSPKHPVPTSDKVKEHGVGR